MTIPPVIAVVDYGAGNLRSVAKALERSGMDVRVTDDPAIVRSAEGVVLPGAGAFADAMHRLRSRGLAEAILESIEAKRPYLGLCLGLQVLFDESDEHGVNAGLGVIPGRVEKFPGTSETGESLRVPHIGWNEVQFDGSHPMLERLPKRDVYYFVHSYRVVPPDVSVIVGSTQYGDSFASVVAGDSIFAVQFHPEKSQAAGKRVLDAYRWWLGES
jgi:glutamine amidotransferase